MAEGHITAPRLVASRWPCERLFCEHSHAIVRDFRTDGKAECSMLDGIASIGYNSGMAKRRSKKLTDQVRQAIDDSGLTRYRIAQETGIDESALAKFYNGHQGLSMGALNALGEFLQLKITLGRKPSRKGK